MKIGGRHNVVPPCGLVGAGPLTRARWSFAGKHQYRPTFVVAVTERRFLMKRPDPQDVSYVVTWAYGSLRPTQTALPLEPAHARPARARQSTDSVRVYLQLSLSRILSESPRYNDVTNTNVVVVV